MGRDISPPPSKRRKLTPTPAAEVEHLPVLAPAPAPVPLDDPNIIRVFSWNINGIAPFLQKPITHFFQASKPTNAQIGKAVVPPASLRGFLQRHHWPAVLFLQEVKIASSDTKTQDAIRSAVNARLPAKSTLATSGPLYQAYFTLPTDPHNARGLRGNGKVYGVCSIIRSDLSSDFKAHARTVDWDKEGRVSVVELKTIHVKLALFNIYAVNGTDNPYRDPSSGVVRGTRHDRKLAFHRLLMEECLELEKDGWYVLLAGDMNVAPDMRDGHPRLRTFPQQHVVNRADLNEKFLGGKQSGKSVEEAFDGVDVWRLMNGDERRYTYYSRGREWGTSCDRVDYVIAGKSLWDEGRIKDAGILDSEAERGPSDHVPIWVDVQLAKSEDG